MRIPSGSTDRYIYFVAVDATDFTTRETGLATWTVYRSRNGGAAAAFTTPTINEVDATNLPGVYELLLDEDTTLAAGNDTEELVLHITHAGMYPVTRVVELYRPETTEGETLTVEQGVASAGAEVGTAQAGAAGTITLAASGPVATDDYYNGMVVYVLSGTGAGQARVVTDYVGSTKVATISPNWVTNPSTDSVYIVLPSAPAAEASGSLPRVDVREWLGSAVATPTQAGVPEVDVTHVGGVAEDLPTATALATVDANVDAILVDTGTTIPATLTSMSGATFDTATDSLEALRNRGDAAWTTGAGGTPPQLLQNTTIATLASQTSFTLTAGSADDDAYNGSVIVVTDQATSSQKAVGTISDYVGSTRTVTLSADPGIFTMAVGDTVDIIASTSSLTQADVRAAVGLAAANLDTQIAALPTAAEIRTEVDSNSTQLAAILTDTGTTLPATLTTIEGKVDTVDTVVDAIKVVTDKQGKATISGTAATGTLTTTSATTSLSGYAADELIGRVITFDNDATGCPGFQSVITDYVVTGGVVTWETAAQAAPQNGDGFTIT